MNVLIRERLVQNELAATKLGIREVGPNNHGPWVKKFLAEVGLPEGYAWCDAFQSFEMREAAGHKLPIESASVLQTYATGKKLGWAVAKPARGDLVCYDFDGDGQFNDHIGLVVRVVSIGPMLTLETVEGNTSSGVAGSQGDGDGVFLRRRVVSAKSVGFIRIPGQVADSAPAEVVAPATPVAPARVVTAANAVAAAKAVAAKDVGEAHGESKNDAPFNTPVPPPVAPAPELRSEHAQQ
jgi:hypothetical protein